jgi:pilus assembly protein Flp/PilA
VCELLHTQCIAVLLRSKTLIGRWRPCGAKRARLPRALCDFLKPLPAICACIPDMQKDRIRCAPLLSKLINNQSGVTAIEYALIAALIAVAAIAAFTLVGTNLSTTFSTIAGQL